MGKAITFKFDLCAEVKTPFGEAGLIAVQAVDDGGIQYYVRTKNGSDWYKESQLS